MTTPANPMGTDGFEFIEFASPEPKKLAAQFEQFGFTPIAKHKYRHITLYRQGQINFLLNEEPDSPQVKYAHEHGAGACGMGFRVKQSDYAWRRALDLGAENYPQYQKPQEHFLPAITAIGGVAIYFIDRYQDHFIYDIDYNYQVENKIPTGAGLTYIDHLTHNVYRGNMDKWADYYERLFNFREIRYFDIRGQVTGLISRALTSPCGKIRIPINESTDDQSQIEEFLQKFNGEGIQHIALGTDDIYQTIETLRSQNMGFLDVPDTYYDMLKDRVPWHEENTPRLKQNRILLDGGKESDEGLLLQIFTENMLGPVFFEIIQRKGNEGFGEGNFRALFEAIERDQIRRGVIKTK